MLLCGCLNEDFSPGQDFMGALVAIRQIQGCSCWRIWERERNGHKENHVGRKKNKITATRRLQLKGKLLKKAASMLVAEKEQNKRDRESALNERVPPLKLSGLSGQELQELCKELHRKIDTADEARYDLEVKVAKNETE
ncbi:troponin I, slow skeletal muscle-like, partial [Tachysurus ichikawai]